MAGETQNCECGCGTPAPIATKNSASRGYVKGRPFRFVRGHNPKTTGRRQSERTRALISESRKGSRHPLWKGDEAGYFAKHEWLNRNHPRTGVCGSCGEAADTEYAFLLHPARHTRNRDDYEELCRDCHMEFDALVRREAA